MGFQPAAIVLFQVNIYQTNCYIFSVFSLFEKNCINVQVIIFHFEQ